MLLLCQQERISSGHGNEGLTVYHEGGHLMPGQGGVGSDVEMLDRLACGVKILSGK